jgi:hypothetical protein
MIKYNYFLLLMTTNQIINTILLLDIRKDKQKFGKIINLNN